MNKLYITIAVMLAWLSAPLALQAAAPCVPTKKCEPPPCEFFEQIKMKQAVMRLFSKPKVRQQLIRKAGGDNAKAALLLNEFVEKKAAELGKKLRCPWKNPLPPPGFETNPSCEIVAKLSTGNETMSRESALRKLDTCSEFIEAAYDHEQVHKDICFKTNSLERANEGITVYAAEERAGYTKELASLRASLQRFWDSCSAESSAETARQVAAAGISVLKSKTPKSNARNARSVRGN
ncbi:MAG: hypothetical protein EXR85_00605 [Xanthomonadales bacterium]|nr:hypothetical protein [Xanthomonadales bacterium]